MLNRLADESIRRSTEKNLAAFESGWKENYELCRDKGLNRGNLRPKYVRPYECIRFQGDYVSPTDPFLSDHLLWICTQWSFWKYFRDVPSIYEFGCGTGRYLYELAQIFPQKRLFGTDWTESSVMILDLMAQSGIQISGAKFDMMSPDGKLQLESGAGILTVGALEQVGPRHTEFIEYLVSQRPSVVVHHEPIEDFYDRASLVDYLGWTWHQARGYLKGFVPALRALEAAGKISIIEARRVSFGDPYHESASRIVWKPR